VPGLLQAARAGTVVMANALGSAFLESPALQGFLPGISRRLLGEDLLAAGLPTWWCGEAAAWADVREQLDDKVVRSTFPRGGRTSHMREAHTGGHRATTPKPGPCRTAALLARTRSGATACTARRAPQWCVCTPSPTAAGRWHVLPGGMTRVSRREEASVSMQRGGTSLDTWVLTDGPVDTFSMLPQRLQVDDIVQRRRPGQQPHRREPVLAGPLHRAHRTAGAPGARHAAADRRRQRRLAAVLQALSALAVRAGWRPAGRAHAGAVARTCSSARCWPAWATRGRRRGAAWPTTWRRWSVRRGAARAAVVRTLGPDPRMRERPSSPRWTPRRANCPAGRRCCRRWTGWRCSWPP
jgi:hypothetical protein